MPIKSQISKKMKIFPKGQVVIPVELRRKYHLEIGDHVNFVSTEQGILLKPTPKQEQTPSLTNQLFGVFNQYTKTKSEPTKKNIRKVTETGFTQGWKK